MFLKISLNSQEKTCASRVSFFNKRPLKKRLWHRFFPVNFAKFLRIVFLQNTSGRLLLLAVYFYFLTFLLNCDFIGKLQADVWINESFCRKKCFPRNISLLKWFLLFQISTSTFLFMIKYLKQIEKRKKDQLAVFNVFEKFTGN